MNLPRLRVLAVSAVLGAASLAVVGAQPASAAVDPASCTYRFNLSINQVTATCYNPTQSNWYLKLTCYYFNGTPTYVNGSMAYGAGTKSSTAQCPYNTEIGGETIVNV